jgi:hypothetical protein
MSTPSVASTFGTCELTVFSLITSSVAIASFVAPAASRTALLEPVRMRWEAVQQSTSSPRPSSRPPYAQQIPSQGGGQRRRCGLCADFGQFSGVNQR